MLTFENKSGLPKYGPHGVLVSGPHGVTRDRLLGTSARMVARLKAEVEAKAAAEANEEEKRRVNAARASGSSKAGQ